MTYEQKLAALKALTPTHLEMREPGNWYVSAYARECRLNTHGLIGHYGNGKTPEDAINDDWEQISTNPRVIINAMSPDNRREVRWNGFMWETLSPE